MHTFILSSFSWLWHAYSLTVPFPLTRRHVRVLDIAAVSAEPDAESQQMRFGDGIEVLGNLVLSQSDQFGSLHVLCLR